MCVSSPDLSSEREVISSNCLFDISTFNIMSKITPQAFLLSPAIFPTWLSQSSYPVKCQISKPDLGSLSSLTIRPHHIFVEKSPVVSTALGKNFEMLTMTCQSSMTELPTAFTSSDSILCFLIGLLSVLQIPHHSLALWTSHLLVFMKSSYPHFSFR